MVTEAPWLDAEQQRSWRAYLRGDALLQDALARDLACAANLSLSEYEVLVWLSESEGHYLRMSTLADRLVHSRSRLTHTIKRLECRGLVRRVPSEHDRRGIDCRLTDEGYQLLVDLAPRHVAAVRRHLVDVLSAEQLRVLGEAFAAVGAAVEDAPAMSE